jgi:cathepsin A (carboxypeptidase C)
MITSRLVLGPGSSSLLGLLQENGPLLLNATGGLMENPYAWTNVAHLLVLESPVGVGYSYCERQQQHSSDGEEANVCINTDQTTATATRAALVDFFTNKFPQFLDADFFITGESYAGVYIPTLAYEILQYNNQHKDDTKTAMIPLKGLFVGDPCTDNASQHDSMDALWYSHKYGLVDDEIFDLLWNQCYVRLTAPLFQNWQTKKQNEVATNPSANSSECQLALRKFLLSSSNALSQGWRDLYIDDYSLFANTDDREDDDMAKYLNRPDVREALHVTEAPIQTWPYPDAGFDYTKQYNACNEDADENAPSMIDFYRKIVPHLDITWIYNGDTDPCVSYEGTRTAVKRIGFSELDGGAYRPWFYNHTAAELRVIMEKTSLFGPDLVLMNLGPQFGGEVVNYDKNLSFVTVHGSGHMVPQFRPQAALHLLAKLVRYKDLSPPLASNDTLAAMSLDEFDAYQDKWTEAAKGPPYVPETHCNCSTMLKNIK